MRKVGVLLVLACMCVAVVAEANCGKCEKKGEAHGDHRLEALKAHDKDGDGKLSEDERAAAREAWQLKRYDKDGDGKLSEEEKAAAEEAKKKFTAKFDKDGDGKLSEDERKAMRESHRKRKK